MLHNRNLICAMALAGALAACAQTEAPPPIIAEPIFDKFGTASCRPADQPISSAYPADIPICTGDDGCIPTYNADGSLDDCLPPDDECIPGTAVTAAGLPCPPPGSGRDDRDDRGPDPRGSSSTGSTPPGTAGPIP